MRKKNVLSMPLHIVRRSIGDQLSLVWVRGEYPAAFQRFRPVSLDGRWKGGTSFETADEVIDAVHSYAARGFGRDKKGKRFLTIDEAFMSPLPFSPADVTWAEETLAAGSLALPTDASLARKIVLHEKVRAKGWHKRPLPQTNHARSQ